MEQFLALALTGWIFLAATALGRKVLIKVLRLSVSPLEATAFSAALGSGLLSYLVFLAGTIHFLTPQGMLGLLLVLTFLCLHEILWLLKTLIALFRRAAKEAPFALTLCLAVFLLAVIQALIPSTAHDAMAYHLDIPKRFVQSSAVTYIPYGVNSVFPLLFHMNYALALAVMDSTLPANLLHLSSAAGILLGMAALCRKRLPVFFIALGWLILILTPGIFNQMVIAYSDIALGFFIFFVFYAVLKFLEDGRTLRWLVLAGIYLGFALSVKYLGALAAFSVSLLMLWELLKKRISLKTFMQGMALLAGLSFLFSFVWYARAFWYEGDFLYFGEKGYETVSRISAVQKFWIPWLVTMKPDLFGGSWAQIGPVYLAFLPLLIFVRKDKWVSPVLILSFSYALFWIFLPRQNLRFLFPVLPFWAIALSWLFYRLRTETKLFKTLSAVLMFFLFTELGTAFYHGLGGYQAALGLVPKQTYLREQERTYSLARFMNESIPKGAKVLNAYEVRMFHLNPQLVREPEFRQKTRYDQLFQSASETIEFLKSEGFTHLLIAKTDPSPPAGRFDARSLVLESSGSFELLYQGSSAAEPSRTYAIYAIR